MLPLVKPIRTRTARFSRKGFTLTELMIAAFLTIIVVSIGGWGIATILTSSKTNESQNERRGELNRSLDFITSEVRQSTLINKDMSKPNPTEFSPSSAQVDVSSAQTVLRLTMQGLPVPVIYYLASPAVSNLTWRRPKVVYRWGPDFNDDGTYLNPTAPSSWTHKPVVDALDDARDAPVTVSCRPASWTASPASNVTGFYACIDSNNKIAQIFMNGRITKALGAPEIYHASAQAFSRTTVNSVLPDGLSSSLPFSVSNGEVSLNAPATMNVQVIGSAIQCGDTGSPMKTQFVVNKAVDGTTTASSSVIVDGTPGAAMPADLSYSNEPAGTRFNFTGSVPVANNPNNTCDAQNTAGAGFNSVINNQQVIILFNGSAVPSVKGLDGQKSVMQYLSQYMAGGKIALPDPQHQYIVLFELGVTDRATSAFDLQDIVLLGSVTPS